MKKNINGRLIEIENMNIFEKAARGRELNRTVISNISDTIGVRTVIIDKFIKLYRDFYKLLPYPLYLIDSDIKYAAIGSYIKRRVKSEYIHGMWIDNGLYILIDEANSITLSFINSTWGVKKVDNVPTDNVDMMNYTSSVGFAEFMWVLRKISRKEPLDSFYKEFMPELTEACDGQTLKVKWELARLLDFHDIPDMLKLKPNMIYDISTGDKYYLDIYTSGLRETEQDEVVMTLDDSDIEYTKKKVRSFGFDVYVKKPICDPDIIDPNEDRLHKCDLYGAIEIYNILCSIRNVTGDNYFVDYLAFISGDDLIFSINGRLFITKAKRYVEAKEIARDVEIYGYSFGCVYFSRKTEVGKNLIQDAIYGYYIEDERLTLCKVRFIKK